MRFQGLRRGRALLAVCPTSEGLGLAVVRREQGVPPVLELCEYAPLSGTEDLSGTLRRSVRGRGLKRLPCTTVLELDAYSLLLLEAPQVPPQELPAALRWRVKDLVEFPVEEAVIDFFEVPAGKGAAGGRWGYAVVARAERVKQRADLLLDAGLRLTAIDIPELCIRNVAALLPEDVAGVAFVYLAPGQGLLTLTRQATLYFARRLQTGIEPLWRQAGSGLTAELERWLDAIVIEVQRSLDYYESHFAAQPVAGLVLGPLGEAPAGIVDYLRGQLGVPSRVLDLNELIDARERLPAAVQAACFPAIAGALRAEGAGA